MLGKNNLYERRRKQTQKNPRFAIKKLCVGVASVLIGFTFILGGNVHADDNSTGVKSADSESGVVSKPESTTASSKEDSNSVRLKTSEQESGSSQTAESASQQTATYASTDNKQDQTAASQASESTASSETTASSSSEKTAAASASTDKQDQTAVSQASESTASSETTASNSSEKTAAASASTDKQDQTVASQASESSESTVSSSSEKSAASSASTDNKQDQTAASQASEKTDAVDKAKAAAASESTASSSSENSTVPSAQANDDAGSSGQAELTPEEKNMRVLLDMLKIQNEHENPEAPVSPTDQDIVKKVDDNLMIVKSLPTDSYVVTTTVFGQDLHFYPGRYQLYIAKPNSSEPVDATKPLDVGTYPVVLTRAGFNDLSEGYGWYAVVNNRWFNFHREYIGKVKVGDIVYMKYDDFFKNISFGPYTPISTATFTVNPYKVLGGLEGNTDIKDGQPIKLQPANYSLALKGTDDGSEKLLEDVIGDFHYNFVDGDLAIDTSVAPTAVTDAQGNVVAQRYKIKLTQQGRDNLTAALTKAFNNNANNYTVNYDDFLNSATITVYDTNKTVTRKIIVNNPYTGQATTIQTVTFNRSSNISGDGVAYGSWTVVSGNPVFNAMDVDLPGYTASGKVNQETVTPDSADETITINYTANDQKVTFKFVDDDNNGAQVGSDIVKTGKTDQTIDPDLTLPGGYKLANGQTLPTSYKFTADGSQEVVIRLVHATVTVTPDNPKTPADKLPDNPDKNYPAGVAKEDLNKTLTRTIKFELPNGKVVDKTQTLSFTRTATVDEANGQVTYSDWVPVSGNSFGQVDAPEVSGYTPNKASVAATDALTQDEINNWTDPNLDIGYTANDQKVTFKFVDDDNNGAQVGSDIVKTGKTDQTIDDLGLTLPGGYKLANGQTLPTSYKFTADGSQEVVIRLVHATVTVTPDNPKTPADKLPDNPDKNYSAGVAKEDLNKTLTRTIKFELPNGKVVDKTQTLSFTRTATVDEANGQVTYSDWVPVNGNSFIKVDAPEVPGYTPNQASVAATDTLTQDEINNWTDPNLNIGYTANDQKVTFKFVDDDNNGAQVGSDIVKTGKTDQTIDLGLTLPGGYKLADGQSLPTSYKFTADGKQEVVIRLVHATVIVTPDNPKTPADKLPDNPDKNYPAGVAKDDLNKTVDRVIVIDNPNTGKSTQVQSVTFTRSATVDQVNGKVTYGQWNETSHKFAAVTAPEVKGYTAGAPAPEITVGPNDSSQTFEIGYTKNQEPAKPENPAKPDGNHDKDDNKPDNPVKPVVPAQPKHKKAKKAKKAKTKKSLNGQNPNGSSASDSWKERERARKASLRANSAGPNAYATSFGNQQSASKLSSNAAFGSQQADSQFGSKAAALEAQKEQAKMKKAQSSLPQTGASDENYWTMLGILTAMMAVLMLGLGFELNSDSKQK